MPFNYCWALPLEKSVHVPVYIYIYIYGSFHVRTTSKNGSYLSNPVDVGMWGVLYDITLHAKRNVSSTFSYQDILPKIFDLGKHYAFCNIFQSKSFSRTNKKIYRLKVIDFKKFLLFFYVKKIKITIFPIYSNFDFKIAKNASRPIFKIFDKYYL